jgi:UDP-2,3-diacylglucosamine pyrophosphatase LpxH
VNQISPIPPISKTRQYRTIWISDIHLGTRGCKADFLIDFLRYNDADTIYLVGDIIDGWRLKRSWYWPQTHNDVIQKILRKVRKGTRVVYVPGNHDEWLRDYTLLQFGGVEVVNEVIHVTADGRRLLVLHGDLFDAVVKHARWLAMLGDHAYTAVLSLNRYFNIMRRRWGYQYCRCLLISSTGSRTRCNTSARSPRPWPPRRTDAVSMVSSVAIFITPRFAT